MKKVDSTAAHSAARSDEKSAVGTAETMGLHWVGSMAERSVARTVVPRELLMAAWLVETRAVRRVDLMAGH